MRPEKNVDCSETRSHEANCKHLSDSFGDDIKIMGTVTKFSHALQ